jgi:hypothetical protein
MTYEANTCLNLLRNCAYFLDFVAINFKGVNILSLLLMYIGASTWMTTIVGRVAKWECELAMPECCIWGETLSTMHQNSTMVCASMLLYNLHFPIGVYRMQQHSPVARVI